MPEANESAFQSLVRRVRAGDPSAAAELVRDYESSIRRAVRFQVRDRRLRRVLDSADISQSVLASFFTRAALGQYELDRPEQLVSLLTCMARNKLATQARQPHVRRRDDRDVRTLAEGSSGDRSIPGPFALAALHDLAERVRERLTADERALSDQRSLGFGWDEIASRTGVRPDTLRMKLARAFDRIAGEFGGDDF